MPDDRDRGLYGKFFPPERADGEHKPGGKHDGCDYFILDLTHDEFAIPSIQAYALACAQSYPKLSVDLMRKVHEAHTGRALERADWGRERDVRSPAPPPYPEVELS